MELKYRRADFLNETEMQFIAKVDSFIPAEFDREFPTDELMISDRLKMYKKEFNEADFFEVALNESGEIIGFHIIKRHPFYTKLDVGNIYTLWVAADFRRSGVAQTLKTRGEEWAKASQLDHLYTTVHVDNNRMLALNEKMGFKFVNHKMIKKISL